MMRSLFAGVSGLQSHQTRMDVIGNNIANVNTVGYKAGRVTFADTLYQTIRSASAPTATRGGTNPVQVGLGVRVASIDIIHTAGSPQPTGLQTDLAMNGNGFFVLKEGEQLLFTRAGVFDLDEAGWLVSKATGLRVAGWNAVEGVVDTNQPIEEIRVPIGQTIPARATTEAVFEGNLDAEAGVPVGHVVRMVRTVNDGTDDHVVTFEFTKTSDTTWTVTAVDENGNSLNVDVGGSPAELVFDERGRLTTSGALQVEVDGSIVSVIDEGDLADEVAAVLPENPKVLTTVDVVDSLGVRHRVIIEFEKTAENTWAWSAVDENGNYLDIDGFGAYDPADPTSSRPVLRFTSDGRLAPGSEIAAITLNPGTGAEPVVFTPDFAGVSQYGQPSQVGNRSQNGYAAGTLEEIRFDSAGVITGVFSNGLTRALAQLAVATFSNNGGLVRAGDTAFEASRNSGLPQIGAAGTGDRGTVTPGALEMSNVDLSEEFTSMIITQRGFQANSRIITTSDEMLQELVNMKR
ncbi:MAG: flagellar hook protein FlgE [Limnochordales bacterium]